MMMTFFNNKKKTYVERSEIGAVGIKRLVVESGELLSDSVDVCHGFSVGGSERVTVGTRVWLIRFFGSPPTHPSLRLRPSYHIYPTSFLHRLLRRYVIDLV